VNEGGRGRRFTLSGVTLGLLLISPGLAQSAAPDGAQSLFDEGRTLLRQGALDGACAKFAESYRIDPAVGTLLNLAECEERRGHTAAAWSAWLEAAALAHGANQVEREGVARARAVVLRDQLGTLTVEVPAPARLAGLVLKRDEVELGPSSFGTETPLDPGEHVVSAAAPGRKPWKTTAVVERGVRLNVQVPTLEPAASAAPAPAVASGAPEPPALAADEADAPKAAGIYRILAWTMGLLGVIVALAVLALAFKSKGKSTHGSPSASDKRPRTAAIAAVAALGVAVPLVAYFAVSRALSGKTGPVELRADTGTRMHKTIRIAGDPWSGYSTFRGEPRLKAELAKDGIAIDYVDDPAMYDQDARMAALASGKIDACVTTIDAFLRHGANHKVGNLLPGIIAWNIDESNGGDAIFLAKGRNGFDSVQPTDKVCYSTGTPSEHLWDFASLSFANLGDKLATDNGVVASDCWKKLVEGKVQVAVLWQPSTAIALKAGYPKAFATGGQADDVIIDVFVVGRAFFKAEPELLQRFTQAYFDVIDAYQKLPDEHAKFITQDCGADCAEDPSLGSAVLEGIDFLTFEENMCLWWGHCGAPAKMEQRIKKTARLLTAKGKLGATESPDPATILDDRLLARMKKQREESAKLAAEVVGQATEIHAPKLEAHEKIYSYSASSAAGRADAEVGTLRLPNVYFPEGHAELDQNASSIVSMIADQLRAFPALCVGVYGHTNSSGDPGANQRLSEARALAIVNFLGALDGVAFPRSRFDVKGLGAAALVVRANREDLAASRRTEFKLFNCQHDGGSP
jgi:outer membrane protein OmpA-like peptidoglycan-associated protein